ncbi:MAG TPA: phage portal protein [Clostridiales bacterium]|jgi:phage portal protein, HK97 family|nr:phage portal protein [Clostridiales bacterium]
MGLFSRFRNENKARDKPRVRVFDRGKVTSVTRPRADVTLQGHEAIYAAVTRIANTVASIPVHVYKGRERQDTHPLEKLLNLSPNPSMSAYIFKQTMEAFRNTEGMAYALIIRDGLGEITRLDVLDPTRVRPLIERDSREIWYDITLEGKTYPIPGYMVLALKHMSANGISGIRPLDVLRGSLDYDAEVKEISLNQLDGINHGVMLEVPGQALDETRKTQIVADFLDAYESSGQRVLVLEGGIKATTFNQSPVDAQLMDVERITRNRVATVYNLPPHMLGDYSDTSFSTAEQQMQEFLQLTIIPIVQQWEDELNRKLLSDADYKAGYRFRFDTDSLIRADMVAMANKYQMAIRGGWMRMNEVREREGLPPDPNGDELMCARDIIPLRIMVEHPELLLTGSIAQSDEGGNA